MATLDTGKLVNWMKKIGIRHHHLADYLERERSGITWKLKGKASFSADQLCKIISLFDEKLTDRRNFAEFLREVVGIDLEAPIVQREVISTDLVDALKGLAQARKELNEQKDRIHELERALDAHRHHLMSDRRDGDPLEINPLELRRPLPIGKNTAKPDS